MGGSQVLSQRNQIKSSQKMEAVVSSYGKGEETKDVSNFDLNLSHRQLDSTAARALFGGALTPA